MSLIVQTQSGKRGELFYLVLFQIPTLEGRPRMKKRECEKNLGQEGKLACLKTEQRSTRRVSKMSQRAGELGSRYKASDTLGWNVHNGKPRGGCEALG